MEENKKQKLRDIFTDEVIDFYKKNKQEITSELLNTLRAYGNEGKHIALDILDIEKDEEQYYLDSFGNRMSFNGNRRVKKAFSKLPLYPIHHEELRKCMEDLEYFKDNYVKIRTKSGVNFPDMRDYQNMFIEELNDDSEGIIGLMGRQCCSAGTTVTVINNSIKTEQTFEELFNECKRES